MTNEEILENLGQIVDTCDNYEMYADGADSPLIHRLSDAIRLDALSNGIRDIHASIRELYDALGGEDVWTV